MSRETTDFFSDEGMKFEDRVPQIRMVAGNLGTHRIESNLLIPWLHFHCPRLLPSQINKVYACGEARRAENIRGFLHPTFLYI